MDGFTLPKLQPRPTDGHKGTFGTVGIIGGSVGSTNPLRARMIGAPALVAMGANRVGCGLIKIGAPAPVLNAILSLAPMATGYPIGDDWDIVLDRLTNDSDALVIGPGLGESKDIQRLIHRAITLSDTSRTKCLVLDADAINALSKPDITPKAFTIPTILTPHPGEAQRLLDGLSLKANPSGNKQQRIQACRKLAERYGCIVALKGEGTVIADSTQHWVCDRGHPCLGVGGTGDVLAGMIGSLAAQSIADRGVDLFASTCIAVDSHAHAGELWAIQNQSDAGLDPRDLGLLITTSLARHRY